MANLKAKEKCFADFNELKDKLLALIAKNSVGHVSTSDFKSPLRKVCASISVSLNNASSASYKDQKHSNFDSFNFINIEVEKIKSSFSLNITIDDLNCGFDDSFYYSYDSGEKLNMRIFTPARRNLAIDKSININITYFDENTTYNKEKVFAFLEEQFTKIKIYFEAFKMFQGEIDTYKKVKTEIETDYTQRLSDLRYKLDAEKTKILKAMDIALAAALYSK
jgi:hypothetical protein